MSETSDTSETLEVHMARLKEEGDCPRFNNVYLLSEQATDILNHALEVDVNLWGEDALLLTIHNQTFQIPEVLTSRGTLDLLGFTESRVQELWDFLKEVDPRTPPLTPVDEFKKRMIEYVNDIIDTVHLRDEDGKLRNSAELLDILGLTSDAKSHLMELLSAPGPGGVAQRLRETHPDYVLVLAKNYIQHRFRFLQEMDSLVVIQQGEWEEEIFKGFTQLPIMSIQAAAAVDVDPSILNL